MIDHNNDPQSPPNPRLEDLWKFSGQGLQASDFNTALVHFYRGELTRSNTWRSRLDTTTNWAVVTTGAALTFAFGSVESPHLILIINTLMVLLFLFIEARRYRYYELWTNRVRIMEQNYFAGLLSPPFMPQTDWAERITSSLKNPHFPISLREALGRRYRRNYAPIFLILAFSWLAKVYIHPVEIKTMGEFLQRAMIGPIPGFVIVIVGLLFHASLMMMGILTVQLQESTSEVLSGQSRSFAGIMRRFRAATFEALEIDLPHLPHLPKLDRRKQLTFIITDKAEKVGKELMRDLGRGVTLLPGKGLYTGKEHGVLMCTIESRQLTDLKKDIKKVDPTAFVIVVPLQGVMGGGFRPLEA